MRPLTTNEYAKIEWGGAVTSKTVINWINSGKKLKNVSHVEITPTGRYFLFMKEDQHQSSVEMLFKLMKSKAE